MFIGREREVAALDRLYEDQINLNLPLYMGADVSERQHL